MLPRERVSFELVPPSRIPRVGLTIALAILSACQSPTSGTGNRSLPSPESELQSFAVDDRDSTRVQPEKPTPQMVVTVPLDSPDRNGVDVRPYLLSVGDEIQIRVIGQDALSMVLPVPPQGDIEYPVIGTLSLSGRTCTELQTEIHDRLEESGFLVKPRVTVAVRTFASRRVYLLEGVRNPQAYDLPAGSFLHLTQVLAMAGGVSESADPSRITILRRSSSAGSSLIRVDLRAILDEERMDLDPLILPGDSIIVRDLKQGEGVVYVTGQVGKPGAYRYSIREGLTFFQAIVLAGGLGKFADPAECVLMRQRDGRRETVIVDLENILSGGFEGDISLRSGDLVFVPESFF